MASGPGLLGRTRLGAARRWQLGAGTVAPIVIALVIAAGIVIGFILWTANDLDRHSAERELQLVEHIITEQLAKVPHDQETVESDRIFVLDAAGRPISAMDRGASADPALFTSDLAVIAPLAARLRAKLATGAPQADENGTGGDVPAIVDVAVVDGVPAVIGILPIASAAGEIVQQPGSEFLQVGMLFLDGALADRLAGQYQLAGARFTMSGGNRDGQAFFPVMRRDGRFVTFFEWQPDRPGQLMLARTAPGLAIGFLIGGTVVLLLFHRLRRSAKALRADRLSAEHQASHDALTGLPNRAQFERRLAEALNARRGRDLRVALLLLDLDRFKRVNDTLGHQAGDDLIRAVGQRLQEIIGNRDTLARLGGDEFAVIHVGRGNERAALHLSQSIIDAVGKPFAVFGSEAFVGVSIGVAVAEDDGTDRHELARKADIALYEAKGAGRNRAMLFEEPMSELLQGRHTIETELREALRGTAQFSVAFQPLFSRETGRITGAEALARWRNPQMGQVSPARFIPVAEASGLIEALGDLVLRQACSLGARWPGQTIAVNISPTQLRNPAFPAQVFDLLKLSGMRAEDLELEITEGILLEDAHVISEALSTFRKAGLRIALDDFGTGYSSLNYLKRYPVDCIKIDRSFVSQLATGNASVAIVQAMVTLAHALKIEVTAEGVETHEQMAILSEMGCNTFQGFLLSAPVTAAAIETLFRNHVGNREAVSRVA